MKLIDWQQGKENIKAFIVNILVMVLVVVTLFPDTVWASTATISFDETEYEVAVGDELIVLMTLKADEEIGLYNVQVQYDNTGLQYMEGAESESDGVVMLKGTGYSNQITYRLHFRAITDGKAGIFVKDASILSQKDDEKFTISASNYASIQVGNPTEEAVDFRETFLQAQDAAAVENYSYNSDIPVVGAVKVNEKDLFFFVDLDNYEPELNIWGVNKVKSSYNGNELTFLTDNSGSLRIAVLANEKGNMVTYAVKDGTQEFYPVITRFIDGEEYYVVSTAALNEIPEGITEEEITSGAVFYAVDYEGNGGIYQYNDKNGLKEWGSDAAEDDVVFWGINWTELFTTRNIAIFGGALIFILLISVIIVYKRTSRGSYDLNQYWFVVRELTGREIKRKYARSVLGIAWSVLNPLMYMGVMSLIFSTMFKSSIENFPVYYLIAYLFWTLFSTATNTALTCLVDNRNLMQKTKLPREIFVLSRDYTALVNFGFSCIAFALMMLVFRIPLHWCSFLFLLDLICAFLFSTGVSFILASKYVFQRDIKFVYKNLMPLLNHLIAMFYPIDILTGGFRKSVEWNPLYSFIRVGRDCMLYGKVSEVNVILQMIIWSVAMFFIGLLVFKAKENRIIQKL